MKEKNLKELKKDWRAGFSCKDLLKKAFPKDIETVNAILTKLADMGFFKAPASTKYHGAHEGGLYDHSLAVTKNLVALTEKLELKWQRPESPYIVGLFHDLCKCDQYRYDAETSTYVFQKSLLPGHGEKSVIIAQKIMPLTEEEILCIRWHMGAFDDKENWGTYGDAVEKYPNVLYTHTADMMASRIDKI